MDIPLNKKFKHIFFPTKPIWSPFDQEVINKNEGQLIADKGSFFNPASRHNIGQVIVPRLDKNEIPVAGREESV